MTMEYKRVKVEVWPLAVDKLGIYLVTGEGPLVSNPLFLEDSEHWEVQYLLEGAGLPADPLLVQQTSSRPANTAHILTFVAVLPSQGWVMDQYPDALRIDLAVNTAAPPRIVAANEKQLPRENEVLINGLQYFRLKLSLGEPTLRQALIDSGMAPHLYHLEPALAGFYDPSRTNFDMTLPENLRPPEPE